MRFFWFRFSAIVISFLVISCSSKDTDDSSLYVLIPDPDLEQNLIFQGIDSEKIPDGRILISDAEKAKKLYLVDRSNYPRPPKDLTGLEVLINLEELIIVNSEEENIDFSSMEHLNYLSLAGNQKLFQINISEAGSLSTLIINLNPVFNELDISSNKNIEVLDTQFSPELTCIKIAEGQVIPVFSHDEGQYLSVSCK